MESVVRGVGNVVRGDEGGELLVRREHLVVDCGGDLVGETLLVGLGEAGRKFLEGKNEGIGGDDSFGLPGNLFRDEADGNQVIFDAGAQDLFGLEEGLGDLVKACEVILVMLDGVEGHGERKVGEGGVDASPAAGCAEGHLILFEVVVLNALLQLAKEEVVGDEVLLGKAGRDRSP